LCAGVSFNEICDKFLKTMLKKVRKGCSKSEFDQKVEEKLVNTGCICKGKSSGRPRTSAEQLIVFGRLIGDVQGSQSTRASRKLNAPQPRMWKILQKRLALRPYRLQVLQHITPNDRATSGAHTELS
jgi:hypothetical protein